MKLEHDAWPYDVCMYRTSRYLHKLSTTTVRNLDDLRPTSRRLINFTHRGVVTKLLGVEIGFQRKVRLTRIVYCNLLRPCAVKSSILVWFSNQ